MLVNTLYVDFGNLLGTVTMPAQTIGTTIGWDHLGYQPTQQGAGATWIFGPRFGLGVGASDSITFTPLGNSSVIQDLQFSVGPQPIDDPFQFENVPVPVRSIVTQLEQSIVQILQREFAPFNVNVLPVAASNLSDIYAFLAQNNPLLDPNDITTPQRGPLFNPTPLQPDPSSGAPTATPFQDAYILVGGWTDGGFSVADLTGALGSSAILRGFAYFSDPGLTIDNVTFPATQIPYADGGGAVYADKLVQLAIDARINPNIAMATVAAQMASIIWSQGPGVDPSFPLAQSNDGLAKNDNPFFDSDTQLLTSSDIMRQGPQNAQLDPSVSDLQAYPTLTDVAFFERYPMMRAYDDSGLGNQDPSLTQNAFDFFKNDKDIGLRSVVSYDSTTNMFFVTLIGPEYVSGTGTWDDIRITPNGVGSAMVTITAYRDNTFLPSAQIGSPVSYAINLTETSTDPSFIPPPDFTVLVEMGRRDDRLSIDPSINAGPGQRVRFISFGGSDSDKLSLDDATGTLTARVSPNNVFALDFNTHTVRYDAEIRINPTTTNQLRISALEFDDDSVIRMDGFSSMTYEMQPFLGDHYTVTNGDDNGTQTTTIDGTAGGSHFQETVGVPNVEFADVNSVKLQVSVNNIEIGKTNDVVAIAGPGGFAAGLQDLTVSLGQGDDQLTIETDNLTLPGGGTFTYDGGAGTDTVASDFDADWTLGTSLLPASGGGSVQLTSVENANITGGDSNNILWILNWAGTATVNGGFGNDTLILGDGDAANAVTGNITMHGGEGNDSFSVSNLDTPGTATLFGDAGNDNFYFGLFGEIDGVTGQTSIFGGNGTDTLNLDDSGNATVEDYAIDANTVRVTAGGAFGGVTFDNTLENIVLTGSQGDNTFNVTPNARVTINVNGSSQTTADSLFIDFSAVKGQKLILTGPGAGRWTFTSGQRNVIFTGMETLDPFNPLLNAPLLAGAGDTGNLSKPLVKIYQVDNNNSVVASFYAYPTTFRGGVRVAMADVNGDKVLDVITAPGPGAVPSEAGDVVKVWDGAILAALAGFNAQHFVANPANIGPPNPLNQSALIASFTPEPVAYKSGLYLAVGDVNNDGTLDIVTSRSVTTAGMQSVRVFANTGTVLNPVYPPAATYSFAPYLAKEKVTTGAQVAIGDVDGDGLADIVTVPGAGSVVNVKVFNGLASGANPVPEHQFAGFESTFKNSASLTLGDVNGDGVSEIMLGAGAGGGSRVRTFTAFGTMLKQFNAYTTGNKNAPLRIVARNVNGAVLLFTAQSNDGRSRTLKGFNPLTGALVDAFLDTDAAFNPGEYLG